MKLSVTIDIPDNLETKLKKIATPAALQAARVYRDLQIKGLDIGVSDSLIAGIALKHGMPIYTENVAHFSRVQDFVVWSPAPN